MEFEKGYIDNTNTYTDTLITIYLTHQNQFQQIYNIVTVIGMGWMATIGLVYTADDSSLWLKLLCCLFAFLCILLEYFGIKRTRSKLKKEREEIMRIGGPMTGYATFLEMPREVIGLSDILLEFEMFVYFYIFAATIICHMQCICESIKVQGLQFWIIIIFCFASVVLFIVSKHKYKREIAGKNNLELEDGDDCQ